MITRRLSMARGSLQISRGRTPRKRHCTARNVARQVRINARIYPSLLLAACKCVKKCVRLWLANGSTAFKKHRDETALKQVATQKRMKREKTILRICLPDSDIVLPSDC
jgi:hypothetical protein